ncbi:hypothetical protein D3C81_669800 [compost metagenome]
MAYFTKEEAIAEALKLVYAGLQSGAITLADGHNYATADLGGDAGKAVGQMISQLAASLEKL